MVIAIYPGTFDPITNGHVDIMARASSLFDKTLLAVADSTSKSTLFSLEERMAMANEAMAELTHVDVISFNGLVTDLAPRTQVLAERFTYNGTTYTFGEVGAQYRALVVVVPDPENPESFVGPIPIPNAAGLFIQLGGDKGDKEAANSGGPPCWKCA